MHSQNSNFPRPRQSRDGGTARKRSKLYVASPVTTFGTERYERMLATVRTHLPGHLIIRAAGRYVDAADWRRRWRLEEATFHMLVFFDDGEGCIGCGVWEEVEDIDLLGTPAFFLSGDGRLYERQAVRITLLNGGADWSRHAQVQVLSGARLVQ